MTDIHDLISAERRALADAMDDFTDEQWNTPSLCSGWTVRHVGAHLTMPFEVGLPRLMVKMVGARGDFGKVSDRYARDDQRPGRDLSAVLRKNADTRFKPPGFGYDAPLADIVIHSQDISRPLGITCTASPEVARIVVNLCVSPKAQRGFIAKGMTDGLRLEATDVEWSHGDGAEVRGEAASIALALTGRALAFDDLDGGGVALLRSRV